MRRINKKGAEMAIGTLVVIILSILVLVLIAFGFGMGWKNLWDKISGTFGGGVNVDSLKQACEYACTTQRTYEYCCVERSINYKDEAGSIKSIKGANCLNPLIKPACDLTCTTAACAQTLTEATAKSECTTGVTGKTAAALTTACCDKKSYVDSLGASQEKTCKDLLSAVSTSPCKSITCPTP
jgi:hypothetical protein